MGLSESDIYILNRLVGSLSLSTAENIMKKVDCFLHSKVSLFMPSSGQCAYAVTPDHTHPAYSFIFYFQPTDSVVVEGKSVPYDLEEGRCLSAVSPGILHQEVVQEDFESYIAILIDADLFNDITQKYAKEIPVFRGEIFVPHPELLGVLRCFMLESSSGNKEQVELLDHLASVIAHLAVRSVLTDTKHNIPLYDRFEVDTVIAYMNSHFGEKITIEDLSRQVNRSTGHFPKVFKSVTGMTPMDFLHTIRVQKARNMLINSTKNMTEIALECGFNTSSYFSYCFLEKYKMTPSAFRQHFQQKP